MNYGTIAIWPSHSGESRVSGGPDGIGVSSGTPSWGDPSEVDERVIYRRPDAAPERPRPQQPVQAELVDGVPVYRIYRARPAIPSYDPRDRRE